MTSSDLIRVVLVDDHAIVRTGLCGMLSDTEGIEVVGEAPHGERALDVIAEVSPSVVLMDLRMPVLSGPDTIRRLREAGSTVGILVLTTYDSDNDILVAIESGANGYLLKDCAREDLIAAIRATAEGRSWLAPDIATRVLQQMNRTPMQQLSARELDVLRLVARGRSNKEIAAEMHVSQATVKSHLIHIFRKLDVNDRTAAVTLALDRGIIAMPDDPRAS